jgi:uncharacterized membrane protein
MSKSNIMAYVNNLFTFQVQVLCLIFLNAICLLPIFFTWTALGDADLHFSLILVTKTNAVEGRTTAAT